MRKEDIGDASKQAGVTEDEMAARERQSATVPINASSNDGMRKLGFVSAGVEGQSEESGFDEDGKVETAQNDVPSAVFGDLAHKVSVDEDGAAGHIGDDSHLGALERIKKQRRQ
ncbi:hypothetical protein QJS10_CPB11g00971 [Acorus calamus]|uniref:Uncharacterized protein n=1 Tax=Acorus calamus TaxID=4465 RepID=A0AAV9DXG2_ACOCL|nr:hypothetical protein QJS10_CPB11g00971 [Acorus calamus]